uniref:Dynactin subunit 4 n=1 Tax=Hirondellea gigas TaxID=1518452 RepID=A0A2P2I6C7_9CRUS
MSHLFQSDLVKLLCSCGLLRPITAIYFCRHCLVLRCANCVSHEMDMLYCPNCLENMPSTEARLKKNRCGNCFDCPSCGQFLSTRASSIQSPDPGQPTRNIQRKLYYLACAGCRWTSRDVNIPDQTVATGGWPELEAPNQKRILALLEHYRAVAQKDRVDRERKRLADSRVKNAACYLRTSDLSTDKLSSLSPSIASVRKSLATMSTYALKGETRLNSDLEPSVPSEEVEGLPDNIFTEPVVLSQVCSMSQRLACPEQQPTATSQLYPLHKHLLVKRSLRCRHCEHNLSKPEYNPSSFKFKIQLAAYYHVPEIRMVAPVELKVGVEACVQISLCNPTAHMMTVALLPFLPQQHFAATASRVAANADKECVGTPSLLSTTTICSSTSSMTRLIEVPSETSLPMSLADAVRLPQGQLLLAARDDTAEYDDAAADAKHAYRDDPQVVAWRRANKVGVNIYVTPEPHDDELHIGFVLRYDYTNTVIATNTGMSAGSGGSMSLGLSGPTSLGSGPGSGPNSLSAPTAESRTVTLNVPVVIRVGGVIKDSSESHA